jgi:hypothetical protein
MTLERAGINQGWFYSVGADGHWTRQSHPEECPCGNSYVHERHMSALTIIEQWLDRPESFGTTASS